MVFPFSTAYPTPEMLIFNARAKSVSNIPSSITARKQRRLLASGLSKQLSQAIQKVLSILLISKYLSTLYPTDHNMMKNTGGLSETDKNRVGLILAWAHFYHFPALLLIYLFKSVLLQGIANCLHRAQPQGHGKNDLSAVFQSMK
jgi:hypothetical protein